MTAGLTSAHLPNVLAWCFTEPTSGSLFTVFRAVPGSTAPRLAVTTAEGRTVDLGFIERPERFGPHLDPDDFKQFVANFRDKREVAT